MNVRERWPRYARLAGRWRRHSRPRWICSVTKEIQVPADLSGLGQLYLERAARQEEIERICGGAQDRWEEQLGRQQATADRWAWLSPSSLVTGALVELAGTGRSRYLDFMRQKRQFENEYAAFLPRRLALPNSIFTAADYSFIPTMQYREERLEMVFAKTLPYCFA